MQFFIKYKDIADVFQNTKFTKDMIDLMTEILAKISMINSGPAATLLNQIIVNSYFLNIIRQRISDEDYKNTQYLEFLYSVAKLSNKLIDKFDEDVKRIKYSELSEHSELSELI